MNAQLLPAVLSSAGPRDVVGREKVKPFSFEQSTYTGLVSDLMAAGSAKPFIQQWYEPISCTPADTGMPLGGIGSAFTLTPAGTTPSLSLVNGLHVTSAAQQPFRLRNLFFAERPVSATVMLADPTVLKDNNQARPLRRADGQPWITGEESATQMSAVLAQMAACSTLYQDNQAAIKRWNVALSSRTLAALEQGDSAQLATQLLIDVYGAGVALACAYQAALTGNVAEDTICGQLAYPAHHMTHTSLYPVCETIHRAPQHQLTVSVESYSPVICEDERSCSLPVSITRISLHNPSADPIDGTLLWSIENLCGNQVHKARPGQQDAWFELIRTAQYQTGA